MKLHSPDIFNKAKLVGVFESGSPEWLEARFDGIGGSDIGTILGLNPWESAYALWAKKTRQIDSPPLTNMAVRFGQKFESPILEIFAEDHPEFELFSTGTYASVERPYMMANPDALARHRETGEWWVIEVKTARTDWAEVPKHYEAQVRWYMDVMGIKKGLIIGCVAFNWHEHFIEYDEFEAEIARQAAERFWEKVQTISKPDWDGSDSTYQAVRQLNLLISDEEVEIDGGHYLVLAQQKADEAYKELNYHKSRVMDLMGTAKYAYIEHEGQKIKIASRQIRAGSPVLVVNRNK